MTFLCHKSHEGHEGHEGHEVYEGHEGHEGHEDISAYLHFSATKTTTTNQVVRIISRTFLEHLVSF